MNKQIEALKLALEALECALSDDRPYIVQCKKAITAIREALASQPARQQEPVAYSYTSRITGAQGFSHHPMPRFIDSESWDIQPLYTSPPASKPWVGLTDEELSKLVSCTKWRSDESMHTYAVRACRAIEAKLREKNA